jgi:ABC-type multidrug transport system fused ATPase/permease subunit
MPIRELFRRFWPQIRPYRRYLLLSLPFIVAYPAIQTAAIWMFKLVVDDVLVPGDFGPLAWIVPIYLGLTVLGGAIAYVDVYLSTWVSQRFILDLRTSVFEHMQKLSLGFFDGRQLGDLLSRLGGDVAAIETFLISGMAATLSRVLRILFFTAALFVLQWQLALVALAVTPVFWFAARRVTGYVKETAREKRRRSGSITAVAEEALSNAALVQAYGRESTEADRFRRESEGAFHAQMASTRIRASFSPAVDLLELISVLAVIGGGTWAISTGQLTIGGLMVFLAYLSQLYSPVRGITQFTGTAFAAAASAERISELLEQQPAVIDRPQAKDLETVDGVVEFERVSFTYPEAASPALEQVSLTVEPGQTLALVGASGAGKSTLAKLLLRFYDPDQGAIRVDGDDVRDVTLASYRRQVSVLLQEALVFDGSVRENIAYGLPGATDEQVVDAAKEADAHEFVLALPRGYDTQLGQKGRRLSGGQRQRIAIARAMIRQAPILILDEPTTGLDADSGRRILDPLRRLMQGRTTIVISHNLATVRDASKIVVLDRGRVVEQGSIDTLLARRGEFARLYRLYQGEARTADPARELIVG